MVFLLDASLLCCFCTAAFSLRLLSFSFSIFSLLFLAFFVGATIDSSSEESEDSLISGLLLPGSLALLSLRSFSGFAFLVFLEGALTVGSSSESLNRLDLLLLSSLLGSFFSCLSSFFALCGVFDLSIELSFFLPVLLSSFLVGDTSSSESLISRSAETCCSLLALLLNPLLFGDIIDFADWPFSFDFEETSFSFSDFSSLSFFFFFFRLLFDSLDAIVETSSESSICSLDLDSFFSLCESLSLSTGSLEDFWSFFFLISLSSLPCFDSTLSWCGRFFAFAGVWSSLWCSFESLFLSNGSLLFFAVECSGDAFLCLAGVCLLVISSSSESLFQLFELLLSFFSCFRLRFISSCLASSFSESELLSLDDAELWILRFRFSLFNLLFWLNAESSSELALSRLLKADLDDFFATISLSSSSLELLLLSESESESRLPLPNSDLRLVELETTLDWFTFKL